MAYTGKVAMGLSKIEVGTPVSGGEATSYETLGYTDPDSCTLDTEDPETTDINAEETDDPIYSISKGGKSSLNFNVLNPELATLVKMMGGEVVSNEWQAPTQLTQPELSVKITMETGHIFRFPRVKFFCKYSGSFGKSEPIKLTCSGSVLIPLDGETAKMMVSKPTN